VGNTLSDACHLLKLFVAVQDLAARFSDGRLSTQKLLNATDEELYEMLIAVKGVGPVSSSSAIFLGSSNSVQSGQVS